MLFRRITCVLLASLACPLMAETEDRSKEEMTARLLLQDNEQPRQPYTIRYDGKSFVVYPDVFSPKFFPDTYWFADRVKVQPGDSFLEIGSGTGLIAVMAAVRGAGSVTTVDINPAAVQNTAENVFKNQVSNKFRIYEGDVFDPIPRGQQFDVIFWFAPFMDTERSESQLTNLEKAVFDPHYTSLNKFLSQAQLYLKRPNGKLLLGFSPTHGRMSTLEKLAEDHGWEIQVIEKEDERFPEYPGLEHADEITVMLLELKPIYREEPAPAAPRISAEPVSEVVFPRRNSYGKTF